MKTVVQPVPRKDESDLEELQANEFASGVIRGIKEFKAGKGKTTKTKMSSSTLSETCSHSFIMNYIYRRVPEFDKQFSKLTKKNKARLSFPRAQHPRVPHGSEQ